MASLALLVCILVGFVVCVGPIAYFICSFSWLSLPIPNVKYLGLIPIALGYFSIGKRLGKPKNNA